jgi:hypothetical protein
MPLILRRLPTPTFKMKSSPEQLAEARAKRIRDREAAFQRRTRVHFAAFKDGFDTVTERARAKAAKLVEADKKDFRSRSFESLVGRGINVRMVTLIYNHTEWLPGDCGRWLETLGMWPNDIQWILEAVSKRRERAMWAKRETSSS